MTAAVDDQRGFLAALVGDGRPLLTLTGLALVLSGTFAIFQSATGHFLPQDVQYLGMTSEALCSMNQCRIVHFMFHDRVSFGGVLVALGSLYMWLAEFPLRHGEPWAWWLFVLTGLAGFGSFLAYLGYGYLDQWHLAATLALLPVYIVGLFRSHCLISRLTTTSPRCLGRHEIDVVWRSTYIAHDRAGFGGGLLSAGIAVLFCIWCSRPSRSLWQVLLWAGSVGFATAIAIHPVIGYTSFTHPAPAVAVALLFLLGMSLCYKRMMAP
ncbi:MAG TPA: hypothetical protein VGN72_18080 [Tepidisphaeraceae bacterium]|jgi:hypothetical protein|nr:hypothetical protein [Tepidisphaeraceae bacterium]